MQSPASISVYSSTEEKHTPRDPSTTTTDEVGDSEQSKSRSRSSYPLLPGEMSRELAAAEDRAPSPTSLELGKWCASNSGAETKDEHFELFEPPGITPDKTNEPVNSNTRSGVIDSKTSDAMTGAYSMHSIIGAGNVCIGRSFRAKCLLEDAWSKYSDSLQLVSINASLTSQLYNSCSSVTTPKTIASQTSLKLQIPVKTIDVATSYNWPAEDEFRDPEPYFILQPFVKVAALTSPEAVAPAMECKVAGYGAGDAGAYSAAPAGVQQRRGLGSGAAVGLGVGALAAGGLAGYALGGGFSSDEPREEVSVVEDFGGDDWMD